MSARTGWEVAVCDVIAEMVAGVTAVALYGAAHPRAGRALAALDANLAKLLTGANEVSFVLIGEEFFVEGRPFTRTARQASALVRRFRRRGVAQVTLVRGVTPDELRGFLVDLAAAVDAPIKPRGHVRVGRIELSDAKLGGAGDGGGPDAGSRLPAVRDRVELLHDIFAAVAQGRPLAVAELDRIARSTLAALEEEPNPMRLLAPWQGDERWAAVHATNVGTMALGLARVAGIAADLCLDLGLAGLTHDLGSLLFPPELREREAAAAGAELELILDHPRTGLEIVLCYPQLPPLVAVVALEHHLHFNGSGYPRLPRPRRPHPASRLIAVVDALDVLLTARGGRGQATRETVLTWLEEHTGTLLDPAWAGVAARLLRVA
ncbi:MAG: HD-GYP domain-containing protein [Acidobacteriota bacterium]